MELLGKVGTKESPGHQEGGRGGFDLVSLDFLEAIISAAERCSAPAILSLAESHFEIYFFVLSFWESV